MKLHLLTLFYISLPLFSLLAQPASVITAEKPAFLTKLYYDSLETTPAIYKGTEHVYYEFRIEGIPYFYSEDMAASEILYNDFVYDSIQAYYDIYKQVLSIEHNKLSYDIDLDPKKVSQFKIHGHLFENLYLDSLPGMKDGYYDKIVDGDVKFYVRREKELRKEIENQVVKKWFVDLNKYYLLKEDIYYKVRGKGSVLKVLAEHKKKLKAHIRAKSISFKASPEDAIEKIIEYYNEL